ncbi:hypothetical protein [Mucilaginibacter ginkgonis]|uniref:Dolichyl-phosphate-mannose-protein mannosyltransferase n=1 Tax=Mucilaginibacter ginkgonis TaxID=2682091 RepID=A0A6I4HYF1_9SPHI|nr:hypothetical protein [Mucilaginibacter ginkgonis]QQL49493.1 hypothetical protein GO620_015165 [Mucilaginibacter ginkgonis]
MHLSENSLVKVIFAILVLATVLAGVGIYLHPMALFPDPSRGFLVMQSMQHGNAFNTLSVPDPQNISNNVNEFISWWSPGQYLLPYAFISLFHISIGQASALTTILCEILGLFGFYQFFRQAGFTKIISIVSIAFIASQVFYFIPLVFYNGGEVLLFGFAGWFLYGCLKLRNPRNWEMVLFIILTGWIGFVCKSSFIWIYAAGLLFIWIRSSKPGLFAIRGIANGLWIAIPAVVSFAGIYFGYLSRGLTPTSEGHKTKLLWETFGFPLASPILSGFSIDEISHGLLFHPDGPMFTYTVSVFIIIALAIASVLLVKRIVKLLPSTDYSLMLVTVYVVCVLFFGWSFFRQLAISYEGRHFRIMGLLLIPGAVYLVSKLIKPYRVLFSAVWLVILHAGISFAVEGYDRNKNEEARGNTGLAQQFLDQDALDEVIRLDNTNNNAIFVFISPDLSLEIQHNRTITLEPIGPQLRVNYNDYQHCGHAGPLYIILPASYRGAKATMIWKSFEDYKGFKYTQLSDDYIMFSAK